MTPPRANVSARERPPVSVLRVPESERRQGQRHGKRGLEQHHLAVPRVDDVSGTRPTRTPSTMLRPPAAAPWNPMLRSATRASAPAIDRQHAVEAAPDRPGGRRERDHQDGRAAQGEKEQGEVEESTGREEGLDGVRVAGQRVQVTAPDVAPRSCTWKTNAPEIGSESAEMARHATV